MVILDNIIRLCLIAAFLVVGIYASMSRTTTLKPEYLTSIPKEQCPSRFGTCERFYFENINFELTWRDSQHFHPTDQFIELVLVGKILSNPIGIKIEKIKLTQLDANKREQSKIYDERYLYRPGKDRFYTPTLNSDIRIPLNVKDGTIFQLDISFLDINGNEKSFNTKFKVRKETLWLTLISV